MHEMSLAEGIVQLIEDTVRTEKCSRVKTVWLEIGQLACVEKEAMRFCFDVVARDSVAQEARLEIIETAGQGWCPKCERTVPVAALYDPCPACGGCQVQVTGGNEMRVKEIEVE